MPYALTALLSLIKSLAQTRRAVRMQDLVGLDPTIQEKLLVVRCDVERDPAHALAFGRACMAVGAPVSFYFHTRTQTFEPKVLTALQAEGHEASYHHECLDRTRGDFDAARELFLREVDLFRRHGLPLKTVCAHGESGLKKVGYRFTYELFDKYPELLTQAGIEAEVYRQINPLWKPVYPSDVFSTYRQFFSTAEEGRDAPGLMELLIHPHRWRSNPVHVLAEVGLDLAQAARNRLFSYRSYSVVS